MAKLTTAKKNKEPKQEFGLPEPRPEREGAGLSDGAPGQAECS